MRALDRQRSAGLVCLVVVIGSATSSVCHLHFQVSRILSLNLDSLTCFVIAHRALELTAGRAGPGGSRHLSAGVNLRGCRKYWHYRRCALECSQRCVFFAFSSNSQWPLWLGGCHQMVMTSASSSDDEMAVEPNLLFSFIATPFPSNSPDSTTTILNVTHHGRPANLLLARNRRRLRRDDVRRDLPPVHCHPQGPAQGPGAVTASNQATRSDVKRAANRRAG